VRDIAAHEFFHIVTPLNIHAEQIGSFDYINPQMSAHLWLYEGVTEYSSIHVQAKYDLYSNDVFLNEIAEKMAGADRYPKDVSFTEMSAKILEAEFEPMYGNVYQKGALIGMCLDLYIMKYSNGEKNLQWLMRQLAKKYGKNVSFKDDELFDVIAELTAPEVGEFLNKYVGGSEPLPYAEVLSWAGISYQEPSLKKVISVGNLSFTSNEKNQMVIADVSQMNSFGKDLGIEKGDAWISVNGMKIDITNAGEVINSFKANTKAGDKVTYVVEREIKGKLKKKKLKAKAVEVEVPAEHVVSFIESPSDEQKALLNLWIGLD
jgi:predicted metalloprotease with PDZ domain